MFDLAASCHTAIKERKDRIPAALTAADSPPLLTFDDALRYGLGRAVLMLETGDTIFRRDCRAAILAACRRNDAFAPHIEDHRGAYLFDVLHATGEPEYYATRIRAILREHREEDHWLTLMDLCARFARMGDDACRAAVYRAFDANLAAGILIGEDLLIELDGIEGYRYVIRGCAVPPELEDRYDYLNFDRARKQSGLSASALSEWLQLKEPDAASYIAGVCQRWHDWQECLPEYRKARQRTADYASVRAELETRSGPGWLSGKLLRADDFRRLAEELTQETDPARQAKYLKLFFRRPFPLAPAFLLRLADSDNNDVSWRAVTALQLLTAPEIRARGLEWMEIPGRERNAAAVLVGNPGDGDMVTFPRRCCTSSSWRCVTISKSGRRRTRLRFSWTCIGGRGAASVAAASWNCSPIGKRCRNGCLRRALMTRILPSVTSSRPARHRGRRAGRRRRGKGSRS
jgi:hypothetical protein